MIHYPMSLRIVLALLVSLALGYNILIAAGTSAEETAVRLRFESGSAAASVLGSISAGKEVEYLLRGRQGQYINVMVEAGSDSVSFHISGPAPQRQRLFNGRSGADVYDAILPADGDYRIRVGSADSPNPDRRPVNYRIDVILAEADPAIRAGLGDFDATGNLPCASHKGQPMGHCDFGVARGVNGTATVVLTKPDGIRRAIFFVDGEAVSADTSQADGYGEFKTRKESDLHFISVGEERYEIPDAVIFGG